MTKKISLNRKFSADVIDGYERAPSRAMLRAVGFTDEDFQKNQIGIASTWGMVTPCNMHIDRLAVKARGCGQRRREGCDFCNDHRVRRDFDGDGRHEIFAGLPRGHCGLR